MAFNRVKLKRVLAEKKITQAKLQKLTVERFPPGISLSAIAQILSGKKSGRYVAGKIALCLGLPERALWKGDDYFWNDRESA